MTACGAPLPPIPDVALPPIFCTLDTDKHPEHHESGRIQWWDDGTIVFMPE